MKLVEALNDLREQARRDAAEFRREVREELQDSRKAYLSLIRWLVAAVVGLAFGGQEILDLLQGRNP